MSMRKFDWRTLFRSEKAKIKPVLIEDVEPAPVEDQELERQQDILSLRLMRSVVHAAYLSGATKERVAKQVSLLVNSGS